MGDATFKIGRGKCPKVENSSADRVPDAASRHRHAQALLCFAFVPHCCALWPARLLPLKSAAALVRAHAWASWLRASRVSCSNSRTHARATELSHPDKQTGEHTYTSVSDRSRLPGIGQSRPPRQHQRACTLAGRKRRRRLRRRTSNRFADERFEQKRAPAST